jgi:hypothetical protein
MQLCGMWEGFVGNPRGQPMNVGVHIPGLILFKLLLTSPDKILCKSTLTHFNPFVK